MKNKAYMLIDFGSTYTKVTLIDIDSEDIIATSKAITTIETTVIDGLNKAINSLNYDKESYEIIKKLGCSSAAGGLKMITIGLVPELTVEAGKRAALGAGARVLKSYSFTINNDEVEEILSLDPDIILLVGGTNGGNKDVILANAKKLVEFNVKVPIIVAGNKSAKDEIRTIFNDSDIDYVITDNVMPTLNKLNVDGVREIIRKLFMEKIIYAKGIDNAKSLIDDVLMPTPAAVITAAKTLSLGTEFEDGIGDLIIVDIGGATTDIHTLCDGYPTKSGINIKGLEEPFAKRTVEGDLGMRYSAESLLEACGKRVFRRKFPNLDYEQEIANRSKDIMFVPSSELDYQFDNFMAELATKEAISRHAGTIEVVYTPLGEVFNQIGKDLTNMKYLIGTGGVVVHSSDPKSILKAGLFDQSNPTLLKPVDPELLVDSDYILSAMGLLSFDYPEIAIKIMKKYLCKI